MPVKFSNYFLIISLHWKILGLSVFCTSFILIQSSCFDEEFVSDEPLNIHVSLDTLRFDTVFTSIGSATRTFRITNLSDNNVIIPSIRLERGAESMFRMNVDGIPGDAISDVMVLAKDSIHVFVEVTVDPDQPLSISPFIINEQLVISSGGRSQSVTLEAWGQNANYFPSRDAGGRVISLTCDNGEVVWDDPKPYVVYGLLVIDSCGLVIRAGTQVYMHGGIARIDETIFQDGGLFFLSHGYLECQGTVEEPIVFQGDRLEPEFDDVSGQWAGIRFLEQSRNNRLSHTTIKNSIVGLRADSAAQVQLNGVQIYNTAGIGLIGIHAEIAADNTLIHSNGPQSVALVYGGAYRFRYTTMANYFNQRPALYMDNFTCLDGDCIEVVVNPLKANFENCIIMGSNDDEIVVSDATDGNDAVMFQVSFDHTLIRVDETKAFLSEQSCNACIEYMDEPVFLSENQQQYSLDTMSLARDQGIPIMDISIDILGVDRDPATPDMGCYEFVD